MTGPYRIVAIGIGLLIVAVQAYPAFGYGGGSRPVPVIAISATVVVPGADVQVEGVDFTADAGVSLTLHSAVTPLGRVTTNAQGRFSVRVTIPAAEPAGQHTLDALDEATGDVVSADLVVEGTAEPPPPPGAGLAGTGVAIAGLGGLGLALVLCGQALLVATRRRTTRA